MEEITNTPENKVKYLSQFWELKVLSINQEGYDSEKLSAWSYDFTPNRNLNWRANLRSLFAITEEEAIVLAKMFGYKVFVGTKFIENMANGSFIHQPLEVVVKAIDYLKSIGIALPWKGVSVITLQEWGWLKLTDQ